MPTALGRTMPGSGTRPGTPPGRLPRGRWLAAARWARTVRVKAPGREAQAAAPLFPTLPPHRHHPLHDPTPPLAVGPAADPPPDHRMAQRPFHRVVRRLNPLDPRERPQALLDL